MEILKKIIFIGLCVLPFMGTTQIYFYNKYRSDSPFDTGNGIAQLPNSSYVVTGSSGGFDDNSSQAYLMLTDSLGNQLWTKDYGGWGDDIGVRVIYLPGDGFFIAGYTGSTNHGDYDFVVFKTNEQGDLQWKKEYGGPNWEILHDAKLLSDGGLILVGQTEGATTDGVDIYMVRTDALGDTLWTKTVSTPEDDIAYAVDTLSSDKFVIGGDMGDGGVVNAMLTAYQNDGTQEWQKFYDQDGIAMVRDIIVYGGEIYLAGGLYDSQPQYNRWLAKTDMDGNYIYDYTEANQSDALITAITIRDAGGLFFSFITDALDFSPFDDGVDAYVNKFGTNFYYNYFSASYSNIGDDIINQLIVTNDGGIALVGTSTDAEDGESSHLGTDLMIAKIGPNDEYIDSANVGIDLVAVEKEQISDLPIYPNPTMNSIHIPDNVLGLPYQIVDFQGKTVKKGRLESTLSLKQLDSGLYILKVIGKEQSWNAKVIKQ